MTQELKIKVSIDTSSLKSGLGQVEKSVGKATKGIEGMGKKVESSTSKWGNIFGKGAKDIEKVSKSADKATSSFKGMVKGVGALAVGLAAIGGVKGVLDGVINRVDGINSSKKTMTLLFDGDTSQAQKTVDETVKNITGTPITLDFATQSVTKAIAAGMDGAKANRAFKIAGDASFTLKGSDEGIEPIMRTFSQIETGGVMTLGHIRSLEDQGVPALKILAAQHGKTTQEMEKMLTKGELGADQLDALWDGIEKGTEQTKALGGGMQTAGDTIKGALSNIKSNIVAAFATPFLDESNYNMVVDALKGIITFIKTVVAPGIAAGMTMAFDGLKAFAGFVSTNLVPPFKAFIGWISSTFGPVFSVAFEAGKKIFKEIGEHVQTLWEKLQPLVEKFTEVGEAAGGDWAETAKGIFQFLGDNAEAVAAGIVAIATAFGIWKGIMLAYNVVMGIASAVMAAFNLVMAMNPITWIIIGIVALIAALVALVLYWEEIVAFFASLWESIKETASTVWNAIKDFFSELWGAIKESMVQEWEAFKELISTVWQFIVSSASAIWEGLKTFFSNLWSGIKETASAAWNGIKAFIEGLWNGIVSVATAIWNGLVTFFTGLWNSVKTMFTTVWNGLKSFLTSTWDNIKSTASEKFETIKDAITKPIDKAKELVSKAIESIKGFFSGLRLKFPKIEMPKLPKFEMTGKFGLNPPSVPKLGLKWMATGGIATGPSVVGIGEAGAEAVLPLSNKTKMKPFAHAVAAMMPSNNSDGGDTYITINATVREEADARRIAEEIEKEKQRKKRFKGGK